MPVSVAYQFMHSNTTPPGMNRRIGDGKASENAQEVSKRLEAKRMHYHSSKFFVAFPTSQNGMAVAQVVEVMVPLPAQGHLNQLPSPLPPRFFAHNIPVEFVGTTTHNT
ncbi:hypothetical protein Adt_43456 [Abeliophyllum distichum]|uniref:Glycosyltransferase N-terminal domain-containing protein n=1 Tax=Abeliophyllum distichum TaxID=126358 RepID=A0ABD1P834_9LAMI